MSKSLKNSKMLNVIQYFALSYQRWQLVQKGASIKAAGILTSGAYEEVREHDKRRPACAKPLWRRQGTKLANFFHTLPVTYFGRMWGLAILVSLISVNMPSQAWSAEDTNSSRPNPRHPWPALLQQADTLGLPTGFLKHIDPTFVTVKFEDLRTYAAEYHPHDHTMILNLRLSFNEAGGALADLARMTHHDVALLYHELLHAYLDYLYATDHGQALTAEDQQVLEAANNQMACHYRFVRINPIRQLKGATELRFLSDQDTWEVMNETWAVFVGWVLWTKLELFHDHLTTKSWTPPLIEQWTQRLTDAVNSGELLGYYEPDDPEERQIARKRFIAPSNGLTAQDVDLLLTMVLGEPPELVQASTAVFEQYQATVEPAPSCE